MRCLNINFRLEKVREVGFLHSKIDKIQDVDKYHAQNHTFQQNMNLFVHYPIKITKKKECGWIQLFGMREEEKITPKMKY